jgi:fumarate hydratase subunit beta
MVQIPGQSWYTFSAMTRILIPEDVSRFSSLAAGDEVLLSGVLFSARDQAHERLALLLEAGSELPVELKGAVVYYMGPAPAPAGRVIGSCGPTTATRMDPFTPALLRAGLAGMVGKGKRSMAVVETMKAVGAVYFYAFGGCGALYAERIRSCSLVAFADLGPEAVYRLEVEDFPVIVAIDSKGCALPAFIAG